MESLPDPMFSKSCKIPLLSSNNLQNFNQIEQKISKILYYYFLLFCSIASVTSYLSENEAKNLKMATYILLEFLALISDVSRTIWHIEVSDGSFICIFHALPFQLNLFLEQTLPLRVRLVRYSRKYWHIYQVVK